MVTINKLSTAQNKTLRKSVSADRNEMNQIRILITDIVDILIKSNKISPIAKLRDPNMLYREMYGEAPKYNLKPRNLKTYHWLFGFKDHARNYINLNTNLGTDYYNRPNITLYHIYYLYTCLVSLEVVKINQHSIFAKEAGITEAVSIIKFLEDAYRQIYARTEKLPKQATAQASVCNFRSNKTNDRLDSVYLRNSIDLQDVRERILRLRRWTEAQRSRWDSDLTGIFDRAG